MIYSRCRACRVLSCLCTDGTTGTLDRDVLQRKGSFQRAMTKLAALAAFCIMGVVRSSAFYTNQGLRSSCSHIHSTSSALEWLYCGVACQRTPQSWQSFDFSPNCTFTLTLSVSLSVNHSLLFRHSHFSSHHPPQTVLASNPHFLFRPRRLLYSNRIAVLHQFTHTRLISLLTSSLIVCCRRKLGNRSYCAPRLRLRWQPKQRSRTKSHYQTPAQNNGPSCSSNFKYVGINQTHRSYN